MFTIVCFSKVRALEAEIEKWRLDYVSLIQSSIRFSGCDTMDDAELVLFGGDRVGGVYSFFLDLNKQLIILLFFINVHFLYQFKYAIYLCHKKNFFKIEILKFILWCFLIIYNSLRMLTKRIIEYLLLVWLYHVFVCLLF